MIVVLRFDVPEPEHDAFAGQAARALEVLAARPGYLRGSAGRATDEPTAWILLTEWADVGSYRRALGNYAVKVEATPLLSRARDEATAFEALISAQPGQAAVSRTSDLAV